MKSSVVKRIGLGDINPFVRVIKIHTINKSYKTCLRYNRHYQFHYVLNGTGYFHINGIDYIAKKGELCLWTPGQVHSIASSDTSPLDVVGVQFDFTRNYSNYNYLPVAYSKDDFDANCINEIIEFDNFKGFDPHIKLKNYSLTENILQTAERYFSYGTKYSEEKASAKLKEFFILVAEESVMQISNKYDNLNGIEILDYIKKNYYYDISNKELAKQFGYHPVHLNRIIINLTGMSLHQYIINLRINEALHLLQVTNLSISQIAEKVGYLNSGYFSRLFKAKTGYAPTYFRK